MTNSSPERTDKSEIIVTRVSKIIFAGVTVLVSLELEQEQDTKQNLKLKAGIS